MFPLKLHIEVERAVKMLLSAGAGKRICKVDTTEDRIVFAQTTHEQFVRINMHWLCLHYTYSVRPEPGRRDTRSKDTKRWQIWDVCLYSANRRSLTSHHVGKVFYLELDGEGKMPVLHFGMTGMLHVNEV